jgi:hypothetical protein
LLSSEDCTLVLLNKPRSALRATVQLCKTNILLSALCALWPKNTHPLPTPKLRPISFYATVLFLKIVGQFGHLGGKILQYVGLTTWIPSGAKCL